MFESTAASTAGAVRPPAVGAVLPLEQLAPGPELAAALAGWGGTAGSGDDRPLGDVPEAELIDLITASERLASWAASHQVAAIRELHRRRRAEGAPPEFTVDEVAAALTITRVGAGKRLHVALELGRLPQVDAALTAGRIDGFKARVITDATSPLPPELATQVADRVLPRAPEQTASLLKASLARAVIAAHPQAAEATRTAALTGRRVVITPVNDGMAELWACLPAEGAAAIRTALDRAARAPRGGRDLPIRDTRTADQRRADTLIGWAVTALDTGPRTRPGTRAGTKTPATTTPGDAAAPAGGRPAPPPAVRAHVYVTVPASTLLGIGDEPGHLAGYGPITAEAARLLATDARWQRLLTDPTSGALLDHGRTTYAPPKALADHVKARDVTCVMPGCRRPAYQCDLDHTKCYPDGATCHDNLGPLCRTHHLLKHHTDWRVEQPTPGTFVWTSPTGHTYVRQPPQLAPPINEEHRRQDHQQQDHRTQPDTPARGPRRTQPTGTRGTRRDDAATRNTQPDAATRRTRRDAPAATTRPETFGPPSRTPHTTAPRRAPTRARARERLQRLALGTRPPTRR